MRESFECEKCGQAHDRCHGHSVRCSECDWSGGNKYLDTPCHKCGGALLRRPCRKWPIKNLNVCQDHGGGGSHSRHASSKRGLEGELRKTLVITGHVEPVDDPFTELAQIAGELREARGQLAEMVARLPGIEDVGTDKYATQLSVVMKAYQDYLGMSARVATDMSRLDLTDRIAKMHAAIDQATARLVQSALAGALEKSSLTPPQRTEVLKDFGRLLRVEESAGLDGA